MEGPPGAAGAHVALVNTAGPMIYGLSWRGVAGPKCSGRASMRTRVVPLDQEYRGLSSS